MCIKANTTCYPLGPQKEMFPVLNLYTHIYIYHGSLITWFNDSRICAAIS